MRHLELPMPTLDALPLGAHRLSALTDQALFEVSKVRIAFFGRAGGVSIGPFASLNCHAGIGDDENAVMRNRAIVCEACGVDPSRLVVPKQVHGTRLLQVLSPEEAVSLQDAEDADGVAVGVSGVPVIMNFADCLPLIIVSPTGRFAVAHAGWRGAVAHIARDAVLTLASIDDASPTSYNAYIGPHIRSECFEVGEEVEQRFRDEFGSAVITDAHHVSLSAAVANDLAAVGLDAHRVCDANICTVCHPGEFFSYRASGGTCGRHAAFACA